MSLLVFLAASCCVSLLLLGGLLRAAFHRSPGRYRVGAYHPGDSSAAAMAVVPITFFLHPRMDLAAGRAPRQQVVNLEQQRSRHELSGLIRQPSDIAEPSPVVVFEPFEQRRKHSRPLRQRLDLVYARETMGDLSDPVCRGRVAA